MEKAGALSGEKGGSLPPEAAMGGCFRDKVCPEAKKNSSHREWRDQHSEFYLGYTDFQKNFAAWTEFSIKKENETEILLNQNRE